MGGQPTACMPLMAHGHFFSGMRSHHIFFKKHLNNSKEFPTAVYGLFVFFSTPYTAHSQVSNTAMGTLRAATSILLDCSGWKMGSLAYPKRPSWWRAEEVRDGLWMAVRESQ